MEVRGGGEGWDVVVEDTCGACTSGLFVLYC